MNVSRSRVYLTCGLGAAAAGVLGLALTVVPSVAEGASSGGSQSTRPVADPSPKQPGGHTVLTCAVSTNGQPITADPAVGKEARAVTAKGTVTLTNCASPDGSFPNLRSGTATFKGTGQASCTSVQDVAGTGTITWKDAQGQTLGTSTVRPNLDAINAYNPGDMMLVGEVTQGKLKGKRIAGKAAPTSDISQCSSKGVSSAQGSGTVAFIAVDASK
ncbi:hypothetical protein [Microbispora catharanthi]|uniref:Uncharacterized protein n=1 Tax=Microbispora catharanthi TaxID=1712871 RepID=A0A5N6C0W4_9ACTN|nr:hypothetical protein [Microbispora catharanthi]KAB8186341.1 hypothetical protein FH610_005860 [Microbispora catharanthi]